MKRFAIEQTIGDVAICISAFMKAGQLKVLASNIYAETCLMAMQNILVTGVGGPAGNAVVQSLSRKKNLRIIGADANPFAAGRFGVDKFYVVPLATDPYFVNALTKISDKEKVKVIIPTVDEEIQVLSKSLKKFEVMDVSIPIPDYETISIATDKWLTVKKMQELGIPVPRTFAPSDRGEFIHAIDSLGIPCIKKPRIGRGGRGFEIISSKEDCKRIMEKNEYNSFILQEYLDGDLFLAQLLGDGKGNVLTSIIHKRLKTKDKSSGTATSAITVRNSNVKIQGEKLVEGMKWLGVVSPEFMVSSKYGHDRPFLIEINPRIAGQSHLSTSAGMNLAYYLVMMALGRINYIRISRSYDVGKIFFRVWQDFVFDQKELKNYKVYKLRR